MNEGAGNIEEVVPFAEVAGGLSEDEKKLGVNFESDDEDNPYIQITDFFTSLTTVKYVLDCSNLCEDAFLAPKLDKSKLHRKAKKSEEPKAEDDAKEEEGKEKPSEEMLYLEKFLVGNTSNFAVEAVTDVFARAAHRKKNE